MKFFLLLILIWDLFLIHGIYYDLIDFTLRLNLQKVPFIQNHGRLRLLKLTKFLEPHQLVIIKCGWRVLQLLYPLIWQLILLRNKRLQLWFLHGSIILPNILNINCDLRRITPRLEIILEILGGLLGSELNWEVQQNIFLVNASYLVVSHLKNRHKLQVVDIVENKRPDLAQKTFQFSDV